MAKAARKKGRRKAYGKAEKKQRDNRVLLDLLVILGVSAVPPAVIELLGQDSVASAAGNMPLLLRTIFLAFIQFSAAGLGAVLVMWWRKEKFRDYGLRRDGLWPSCLWGLLLALAFLLFTYVKQGGIDPLPFGQLEVTASLRQAGLPVKITGMALVVLTWGFFQCFNYVLISRKINALIRIKNPFFRLGPLLMGVSGMLVHGLAGSDLLLVLPSLLMLYLMLLIPELTGNSWGSVLVFLLCWNVV